MSVTRNSRLLLDFTIYCLEHPEERFWQALRNWSGYKYILTADIHPGFTTDETYDTFHWEGKRYDEIKSSD